MVAYQQRATTHYNYKARPRVFKVWTLVLKKVFENTTERGAGKLQVNWEGPYIISKASESGAYHLQKLDRTRLLRPWNVANLKQYYQWRPKKKWGPREKQRSIVFITIDIIKIVFTNH